MNKCFDVANYFLKCQDDDAGDLMSNLKLQKLVYYAQGFSLAILDYPLFTEEIKAWEHGPVCIELYNKYRDYKREAIPIPNTEPTLEIFNDKEIEVLEMIQNYYGQFSAWMLRNLTHEDTPWRNAYHRKDKTITHEEMKEYFKTQIEDE